MKIPILLAMLILGFGGFYAAGPYFALNELRDAIEFNDKAKFEKVVDLKAITENLKVGLNRNIEATSNKTAQDSIVGAAIGSAIAKKIVGGAVDLVATPEMAMEVISKAMKQPDPKMDWAFANWDRFVLTLENQDARKVSLVLRSDGMSWQVKAITGLY